MYIEEANEDMCVYIYTQRERDVHAYLKMFTYICIPTYLPIDLPRETDRQTNRQTDRYTSTPYK